MSYRTVFPLLDPEHPILESFCKVASYIKPFSILQLTFD